MTEHNLERLNSYLERFASFAKQYSNGINYSLTFDFKKHSGHIVISGIVHGNEVGSLPAILKIIKDLQENKISYGGKISFFLGNVAAAQKNVRFIETDLNRSFGSVNLIQTSEKKRASELAPLLSTADVYIDFHQTIMPCLRPFYIFEMDYKSYYWARAAGIAKTYVTRKKGAAFSNAGMCTDEYVRSCGKAGITIELSEQGFDPQAESMTYHIIRRSIKNMDLVYLHHIDIKKIAHKNEDFEFFHITHKESFNNPTKRLNSNLKNFTYIEKNAAIGFIENNILKTPTNGYVLFPKYPNRNSDNIAQPPLPGELYVLAQTLKKHPLSWLSHKSKPIPKRKPSSI